jgi:shikimate dehydrogenase
VVSYHEEPELPVSPVVSGPRRLAVLGSPIAHSRSPALHAAAYRALGLPWTYEAVEVGAGGLGPFLAGLDGGWRGLSLTMPLKREALALLDSADEVAELVGAANTVLLEGGRRVGFNTDVQGAERMLAEAIPEPLTTALVLGAGATACSIVAALARRGVRRVTVWTRSPERSGEIAALAGRLGVALEVTGDASTLALPVVVVSTLPGTAEPVTAFPRELRAAVPLVDIAYDPRPTGMARHWREAGGAVVDNGIGMLLYHALAQVRIFVAGDPHVELDAEPAVLAAMREAAFGPA